MPTPAKLAYTDSTLIKLARELVMEIHDPAEIFTMLEIRQEDWVKIQKLPVFIQYLTSFQNEWNSTLNTEQRVKIKSAYMIEAWLEEANSRMHAIGETLPAKTELAKLVSRLAGQGFSTTNVEGNAESVKITINLGSDTPLKIEKDVTPRVIDAKKEEQ